MNRQRGFTLIELLVVIAIIALLMSILMPALHQAKLQAETVICQTRLKHWGLVFKLYTDDWDGYFNHGSKDDKYGGQFWFEVLRPYYKDTWELLMCPTSTKASEGMNDYGTYKAKEWTGGDVTYVISYGLNTWSNYLTTNTAGYKREPTKHWRGVHSIKEPSTIPLLGDSTHFDGWPQDDQVPPPEEVGPHSGDWGPGNEIQHWCINRHNGFINMLFMDWGVRKVGLKELWTLKWHREFDTKNEFTLAYYVNPEEPEKQIEDYNRAWFQAASWMARFGPY